MTLKKSFLILSGGAILTAATALVWPFLSGEAQQRMAPATPDEIKNAPDAIPVLSVRECFENTIMRDLEEGQQIPRFHILRDGERLSLYEDLCNTPEAQSNKIAPRLAL